MHRLAHDWGVLRQRVNAFFDQFAAGSHALLRYVGLLGDGKLARALQPHDYPVCSSNCIRVVGGAAGERTPAWPDT